jgi:hypothetical protein
VRSTNDVEAPDPAAEVVRPPLAGRIFYVVGGTLRPESRTWVWHDLTGPGWRHRQALRPVWCMVPFAIAFAVAPGPANVRVSIPLGLIVIALVMGYATSEAFRNKRLERHGLPRPKPVEEDDWDDEPVRSPDPVADDDE